MMMRWRKGRVFSVLAAAGLAVAPGLASAQDTTDDTGVGTTETEYEEVTKGVFDSPVILSFRGGPIGFSDEAGNYTSRMAEGINLQFDVLDTAGMDIGVESGVTFSHIGAQGSGFFGDSDAGDTNA